MYEDSQQRMAAVEWADAIKTVSGALTKINKKSPHAQDRNDQPRLFPPVPPRTELGNALDSAERGRDLGSPTLHRG